jgi:proline racemase
MSRTRPLAALAILALLALAALAGAQVALAVFNKTAKGGPITVATSTLAAPTGLTVVQAKCRTGKAPEVELGWTATTSSYATSYSVERSTTSNGTYTLVASVAIGQSAYTDKTASLAASTTYYYRVGAVYHSWTAASSVKSVKTLSSSCV